MQPEEADRTRRIPGRRIEQAAAASDPGAPSLRDQQFREPNNIFSIPERTKLVAENILSAVPALIRERAAGFKPPLACPTIEQIVEDPSRLLNLVVSLQKHVRWQQIYQEDRLNVQQLQESLRYYVMLAKGSSQIGQSEEKTMLHARALDQSARIVALLQPSLARVLITIPIPPPLVPEDGLGKRSDHASAKAGVRNLSILLHAGASILVSGCIVAAKGIARCAVQVAKATAYCAKKFAAAVVWGYRHIILPTFHGIKKFSGAVGSGMCTCVAAVSKFVFKCTIKPLAKCFLYVGAAIYRGSAVTWNFSIRAIEQLAKPIMKALNYLPEPMIKLFKAIGHGIAYVTKPILKLAWEGLKLLPRSFIKAVRYLHQTLKELGSKSKVSFSSAFQRSRSAVVRYQALHRHGFWGKIETNDPTFFSRLSIVDVHVIEKSNGTQIPLTDALKQSMFARLTNVRSALWHDKSYSTPFNDTPLKPGETEITLAVPRGPLVVPLPLGYEISGVRLKDAKGDLLTSTYPIKLRESIFGSAETVIPEGAYELTYRVQERGDRIPSETVEAFFKSLPRLSVYLGIEGEAYRDALSLFPVDHNEKMYLLFDHQIRRGFEFTSDRFVSRFLRSSGAALPEAIGGIRAGTTDPFAFFLAAMDLQHEIPAVVITGLAPNEEHQSFNMRHGHSQTAVLSEGGAMAFDLSAHCSHDTLDSSHLGLWDKLFLMRQLARFSYEGIFYFASELRRAMTSPEEGKSFLSRLTGLLSESLKPIHKWFNSDYGQVNFGPKLHTGATEVRSKYAQTVAAVACRMAAEAHFDRVRETHKVSNALLFYENTLVLPTLSPDDIALLPKGYEDTPHYSLREHMLSFMGECLATPAIKNDERTHVLEWIKKRVPKGWDVGDYISQKKNRAALLYQREEPERRETLTMAEFPLVFTDKAIAELDSKDQEEFIIGGAILPFIEDEKIKKVLATSNGDDILAYCKTLQELATEFSRPRSEFLDAKLYLLSTRKKMRICSSPPLDLPSTKKLKVPPIKASTRNSLRRLHQSLTPSVV